MLPLEGGAPKGQASHGWGGGYSQKAGIVKPYAIGIDVGGTKIAAGLVGQNGQILHRYTTHAHSEQQPDVVIDAIEQAFRAVIRQSGVEIAEIEAVGLGFPGNTNGPAGLVLVCSNLPAWDHVPLRDIVAERIGVPVLLDNDTNLGAVGEHRFGAGRGARNMCYVTFSTGYGMGIIINNQLYVGHTGTAGELGHVVIDVGGPPCTCGKNGCVMAYASGIGLSRMAYEKIEAGVDTLLRDMARPGHRRIPCQQIVEAAGQGDEAASEILRTAGYYCGVGPVDGGSDTESGGNCDWGRPDARRLDAHGSRPGGRARAHPARTVGLRTHRGVAVGGRSGHHWRRGQSVRRGRDVAVAPASLPGTVPIIQGGEGGGISKIRLNRNRSKYGKALYRSANRYSAWNDVTTPTVLSNTGW